MKKEKVLSIHQNAWTKTYRHRLEQLSQGMLVIRSHNLGTSLLVQLDTTQLDTLNPLVT